MAGFLQLSFTCSQDEDYMGVKFFSALELKVRVLSSPTFKSLLQLVGFWLEKFNRVTIIWMLQGRKPKMKKIAKLLSPQRREDLDM